MIDLLRNFLSNKKMLKIACIYSFKESDWISCQKIVFNLHRAYFMSEVGKMDNFNYSEEMDGEEFQELAQKLVEAKPDVLLIIDHRPHPLKLLSIVLRQLEYRPRIVFHVFGDFSLHFSDWHNLGQYLLDHPVDFVVASDAQKKLVDKFLRPENASVVCPFLVRESEYSYFPELRQDQRKEWNLNEEDFVFVYSGRLSYQKNIHLVLDTFSKVAQKWSRAQLFFYGNPDHLGEPFFQRWEVKGEYFREIYEAFSKYPDDIKARIHFKGHATHVELRSIYQGADFLINLSTHNDEDFGMSVAESMCSGLPSLLTAWGGLNGFWLREYPEAVHYVPVTIGQKNKIIDEKQVIAAMEEILAKSALKDRKKISELALQRWSVNAGSKTLKDIYDRPGVTFSGYSDFFIKFMKDMRLRSPDSYFMTEIKHISPLYKEIYSAYVRDA